MTEKHLTVILYGSDRNLWNGAPVQVRVTDLFAPGGPRLLPQVDRRAGDLAADAESGWGHDGAGGAAAAGGAGARSIAAASEVRRSRF